MASRSFNDFHPDLLPLAIKFRDECKAAGLDILITCTYRSNAEQDALYAIGRTKPGKRVTNAKAGQSAHNFTINGKPASKAFDFVPLKSGKPVWDDTQPENDALWQSAGNIALGLGLTWYGAKGASFNEKPHVQL